jgi:taurine dioxygenase
MTAIEVRRLTGNIGAEVSGVDLSAPLLDDEVSSISDALADHTVLVFRRQHDVGPKELRAFSERFGEPEVDEHPTHDDVAGVPGVKVLRHMGDTGVDSWHTDGCTRERTPSYLTILQAIDIPPFGRDTLFANMEAVFSSLAPGMQAFLEGLTALHSWGQQKPDAPAVEHPVVMTHPTTGRKALYVNRTYTRSIVGLPRTQSDELLALLYRQVYFPEYQYRLCWDEGTIAMWDNLNTQHYLLMDVVYPRVMHRVMTTATS